MKLGTQKLNIELSLYNKIDTPKISESTSNYKLVKWAALYFTFFI